MPLRYPAIAPVKPCMPPHGIRWHPSPNRRVEAFVTTSAQSILSAKYPKQTEGAEEEKSAG